MSLIFIKLICISFEAEGFFAKLSGTIRIAQTCYTMALSPSDSTLKRVFRQRAKYLMLTTILLAVIMLIAWEFGLDFIKYPLPLVGTMSPVSAVCFLSLGISFLLIHSSRRTTWMHVAAYLLAAVPVIIGIVKFTDFLWGFDSGIDNILFSDKLRSEVRQDIFNHMAPNTAFNFILLGIVIIFSSLSNRRIKQIANYATLLLMLGSLFALIGYLYKVEEFFGILTYIPMPLQAAVGFLLAGLAILHNNADEGFMSIISSSNSGGTIARILIPAAILAPITIGYIRLVAQWRSPISVELGVAFIITAIVLLSFLLILFVSFIIYNKDIQRKVAEDKIVSMNLELEQKVLDRTAEIYGNEKRYRSLIENSAEGISLLSNTSSPIYQSPAVEAITGYSLEERKKLEGMSLIHPDDLNHAKILFSDLLRSPEQPQPFQYRIRNKKGHFIWVEGIATNLLGDKDVRAIVTNYRDVSERKESDEKLFQERTMLRTLIDNLPDYIYVKDTASRHIINNKAIVKLLGAANEAETLGKSSIDFFGPVIAAPYLKEDQMIISSGQPIIDLEETTITSGGELKYLLTTKVPLKDNGGNVIGVVGISRDITSQKKIELDLRNSKYLLEKAQEVGHIGHWILEINNSKKLTWSSETCRIFGLLPNEFDERLETLYHFIHPEDLEKVKSAMAIALENHYTYSVDHRIMLRDGTTKWVHEQGEPTTGENGGVILLIGIVQDITERKKAEAEILKLNAELEERVEIRTQQLQAANKEMEAFTYSVSHDLRAPLRIIDGFSQILSEDYSTRLDEEGKKTIVIIKKNAKRMGQLIDDLLDFSRLGRAELKISAVNMDTLVQEVLEELNASGISLPAHIHVEKLNRASGDLGLLKQVWFNLVANAIKYSSKKPHPQIEIGMKTDGNMIMYFVKDNGAGFDMKYYHKLFGVFQRLHNQEEFPGTGVGLALVQRIISRHGGMVWAEAKPGEGASFYFTLPTSSIL